ncbi:MAG: type II toxin-antitoxin system HicB family antitoxin, partial [Planctomycetales bacterium]
AAETASAYLRAIQLRPLFRPFALSFRPFSARPSDFRTRQSIVGIFATVRERFMQSFTAVIERCPETNLFVGYIPGFAGAHSQGKTLDELHRNLAEVIAMLLEDGGPRLESEFIGTQKVQVE